MQVSTKAWVLTIGSLGAITILVVALGLNGFARNGQDEPELVAETNQSESVSQQSTQLTGEAESSSGSEETEEESGDHSRPDRATIRDPNALPEEALWLARSGQVDTAELFELLPGDSFESILDNLEARAFEDPDAYEFTAVYSDFLDSYIQDIGGEDFELDGFACGLRTCIGQIGRQDGSESDWIKLGQLGTSSNGPPVYLMHDQRVTIGPDEWGDETTVSRFFISIDPDTNSFEFP